MKNPVFSLLLLCLSLYQAQCGHLGFANVDLHLDKAPKNAERGPENPNGLQEGILQAQIMHRGTVFKSKKMTHKQNLLHLLKGDEQRIKTMSKNLGLVHKKPKRSLISAPVTTGLGLGIGEYLVRLGIGNPANEYYLEVDTGSDVSWVQCAPCQNCYRQIDPIYDPRGSSSYQPVYCGSPLCSMLDYRSCKGFQCTYMLRYSDQSVTFGDFGTESFSLDGAVVPNIAFGCGHSNYGLFQGEAGLMGLGGGRLSFLSQLGATFSYAFSYCLVNRDHSSLASPLAFGPGSIPASSSFTPLYRHPRVATYYYTSLLGISVGNSLVPVSSYLFQLQPNGTGGVILDTGTAVSRLVSPAYTAFRDAFKAASLNLPYAPPVYLLDTCFNFSGLQVVQVPSVVFHLQNGVDLPLPGNNIVIPVDNYGTYCLAFAPSSIPLSILGNIQQQTFRFGIDIQRSLISVAPQQC